MAKHNGARKTSNPTSPEQRGAGPLVIYLGRQGDGTVYRLGPLTAGRLEDLFPDARRPAFVHVGYPDNTDFDDQDLDAFATFQGPFWPAVTTMLTGLSADRIAELGGVTFYDPVANRVWELPLPAAQR